VCRRPTRVGDPFAGLSDELLQAAAAARGFRLVDTWSAERAGWERPEGGVGGLCEGAGRHRRRPGRLTREDIKARYAGEAVTGEAPPPGQPSALDGGTKPEDEGPNKSGAPVAQTTSATRPSATQDSSSPASESTVTPGEEADHALRPGNPGGAGPSPHLGHFARPGVLRREITAFLSLSRTASKRAAARALETIAADEALTSKVITDHDLSTNGAALAPSSGSWRRRCAVRLWRRRVDLRDTALLVPDPDAKIDLTVMGWL
jgi:hypothetical protein